MKRSWLRNWNRERARELRRDNLRRLRLLVFAWLVFLPLSQLLAFQNAARLVGFDGPAQLPVHYATAEDLIYPSYAAALCPGAHCYTPSTAGTNANRGAALQSSITSAAADCSTHGSVVNIPAGFTYDAAPNNGFLVDNINCDSTHRIVIQSASLANLHPQGTRITPSDVVNMPTLTNTQGNQNILVIVDRPSTPNKGVWIAGLDVRATIPRSSTFFTQYGIVSGDDCGVLAGVDSQCTVINGNPVVKGTCGTYPTVSCFVDRVTIDRSWVHDDNDSQNDFLHAVAGTASNYVIGDSIAEAFSTGGQSNAIYLSGIGDWGPTDIGNNEIDGYGEGMLTGDNASLQAGGYVTDVFIHQNRFNKPTGWLSVASDLRSHFECKSGQRFLIEGNVMTNLPLYYNFLLFPTANGQGCFDITARYNHIVNTAEVIQIIGPGGDSGSGPTLATKRVSFHDNVIENLNGSWMSSGQCVGGNPPCGQTNAFAVIDPRDVIGSPALCSTTGTLCQISDISIRHNSVVGGDGISGGAKTFVEFFSSGVKPLPAGSKVLNFNMSDNIGPAGTFLIANDNGDSLHPLTNTLNDFLASPYTFDRNVITGIVATGGFSNADFPSTICNYGGGTGCTGNDALGFAGTMANLKFVNWNSGSNGDYHLCITSSVPSGCSSQSIYEDTSTDSFNDNTKEGPSPGANIDAVNQMTAGVQTGTYTIQPFRAYGPVQGQNLEFRQWVKFPGYYDAAVSDGSGKSDNSGHNSAADPESWSGINIFHDLQHDPGGLMNLGGANVGLKDNDYISSGSNCGTSVITDSKALWGQVSFLSANNVRAIYKYRGPFVGNGSPQAPVIAAPNQMNLAWNYLWSFYRPGFVNTRFSVDNNCGSSVSFSTWQPRMSASVYTYDGITYVCNSSSGCSPNGATLNAQQYPPGYGQGWQDLAWQNTHCGIGSFGSPTYDPGTQVPWGFLGNTGWMMHSITSSTTLGSYAAGLTPGFTNICGSATQYPVTAEFLNAEVDDSAFVNSGNLQTEDAGGGERSSLANPSTVTINSTGNDARIERSCGWYGDLNIRNSTNALELVSECQSPSAPTMNAGTSPSFDNNYGCWDMTADATPKVDFTLTHTWTSPVLCISGWNGSTPNISVNGVAQVASLNYICTTNDGSGDPISNTASGLLCQFVGLPTNGSGGMVPLASSTHIVITSGALPTAAGGVQRLGTTYQKGSVIIH